MKAAHQKYQSLYLNGVKYELAKLPSSKNKFEKEIFHFLNEWFDNETSIKVQTSGSTGPPKTIQFNKTQLIESAKITESAFDLSSSKTALLCLPMVSIAAKMMVIRSLVSKLNLVTIIPSTNPLKTLDSAIDFAALMPYQFENALKNDPDKLSQIKTIILGGMKVSARLDQSVRERGIPSVYETYGMTETLTHIARRRVGHQEFFECLNGIQVNMDENGCLMIMADHISKDPIATNDVAKLISDKSFKLIGRYDRVINSGGVKISAELIEDKLQGLINTPFFIDAIPDELFGNRPILIIEGNERRIDFEGRLEKLEKPERILFVEKIFLTKSGKIDLLKTKKIYNLF